VKFVIKMPVLLLEEEGGNFKGNKVGIKACAKFWKTIYLIRLIQKIRDQRITTSDNSVTTTMMATTMMNPLNNKAGNL
jgi:hypothetical protein